MKKKKKKEEKKVQEVKEPEQKDLFGNVIEVLKDKKLGETFYEPMFEETSGFNPFKGIGKEPKIFGEAEIFDKKWVSKRNVLILDIAEYLGEGEYDVDWTAYTLLLLDVETRIIGTVILGGQFLSDKLRGVFNKGYKGLPLLVRFQKGKAWSMYKAKK